MTVLALILALILDGTGSPAQAAGNLTSPLFVRAGLTSWGQVNQMHLGAHLDKGEFAPNLALVPGVEIGWGDGFTIMTINGDLVYRSTELVSRPWEMYGGGSLSLNFFKGPSDGTNTDLGLSGLLGITRNLTNGHTALAEIRLGLVDSPDWKLTLGYSLF